MMRRLAAGLACACVVAAAAVPPQPAQQAPAETPTTPPPGNDQSLRKLSPDEIPPNLSFYAVDPLYKPGMPLGWASEEIRERVDRGLVAIAAEGGRVHLSWPLLATDPPNAAFNIYRSTGGGETRLNTKPIQATTDYVDARPSEGQSWRVAAVVNGRDDRTTAATWSQPPVQSYRSITLREDIRSVDRVGIGDLDGDGHYDFVVKHPAGNIDPGRRVPRRTRTRLTGTTAGRVHFSGVSISGGTSTTVSGSRRWWFAISMGMARRRSV
jgi:hypothetical protein